MSSLALSNVFNLLPPTPFFLGKNTLIISNKFNLVIKVLEGIIVTTTYNHIKNKGKGNFTIYQYDNYTFGIIKIKTYYDAQSKKLYIEFFDMNKSFIGKQYYYQTYHALLLQEYKVETLSKKLPLKVIPMEPKPIEDSILTELGYNHYPIRNTELHAFLINDFWNCNVVLKMAENILLKCRKYKYSGWEYLVWWNLDTRYNQIIHNFDNIKYQVMNFTRWHIFWIKYWDDWVRMFPLLIDSFYNKLCKVKSLHPICTDNEETTYIFHQVTDSLIEKVTNDLPPRKKCLMLPLPTALVRSHTTH